MSPPRPTGTPDPATETSAPAPSGHADLAARGLADRLKTLLLALDRRDRLETAQAFVGWLDAQRAGDRLEAPALEVLLRALRIASDPVTFDLLRRLDPLDSTTVPELLEATGLGRVALTERLHDMAQTGLAALEMVGDQVRGTELGRGLAGWLTEVSAGAARLVDGELPPRRQPAAGSDD